MIDATILQIGNDPQLFVDNWLIEQTDSVTRRWHKPIRVGDGPVIVGDRPWEHTPYFTYSNFHVLRDPADDLIKCWYEDLGPMAPHQRHPWQNRLLYAESRNGVDFEKPTLGRVQIDGTDTNIVAGYVEGGEPGPMNPWADMGVHSAALVINPDTSAERYRMLFSRATPERRHVIECAFSSDGIAWQSYGRSPSFGTSGSHLSDVSTISYDPRTKLYLQYTRHGGLVRAGVPGNAEDVPAGRGGVFASYFPHRPDLMNKRRVFRTVSADFLNWDDLVAISTPDEEVDNLDDGHYGMGQFRVGALHLGTLGVLHYVDNTMDVRLLFSHDGIHWKAADNARPFLEPRGGGWDRRMVSIVSPPITVGDQWHFYHGGSLAHHDFWWASAQHLDHEEARDPARHVRFGMGVATLRREGIVSLDACAPRIGRVITRPLEFSGQELWINARSRPNGTIRVAMSDVDGRILPGRSFDDSVPFDGDAVRHQVRWRSSTEDEVLTVGFRKLHFLISEAELFGFGAGTVEAQA